MNALTLILSTVLPVFIIIFIGYIIGRKNKLDTQPFTNLLVYITVPSLIVSAILKSKINVNDFSLIFFSAISIVIAQGLLFFLILKMTKSKKVGLSLPATIGNTGFLGYPIALFAFGELGLSSAIVYDMANSLIIFSLGIYIVHHKNEIKEIFKIPLIYAVLLGVFFNVFKISLPDVIFKPIEMIGAITIPLALLLLGYNLTKINLSSLKTSLFVSLYRIAGGFAIGLLISSLLNLEGLIRNIVILQSAMPSAVMSMILTQKYKRDADIAATVVLITTLLGILSIPIVLLFLS